MRKLLLVWLSCLLLLAGCASLTGQDPLRVTLAGVESLPGQGMEVRMAVKLRVQNPNDAPVNFDGVAVTLELRGMDFASGVSDASGSVPRFGETVLVVPVTVSAFAVARQVISLASGDNPKFEFVARGKLSDGSFGGARFESKGSFDLPAGLPRHGGAAPLRCRSPLPRGHGRSRRYGAAASDPQLRAARRTHGAGTAACAGRTGTALPAALPAPSRWTSPRSSDATRPRCWRSASAWAMPRRRSPPRCRRPTSSASRCTRPGVGALLKRIGELGLTNLRLVQHDAVEVLQAMIAPQSLAGVHIYFPDPWHKKRHHKRRLIQPLWVRQLVTRMAPGGYLHCATDWQPYAEQMLEVLAAEPALINTAEGYAPRPAWRPQTKFETRGLKLGHGVWDLLFRRR